MGHGGGLGQAKGDVGITVVKVELESSFSYSLASQFQTAKPLSNMYSTHSSFPRSTRI